MPTCAKCSGSRASNLLAKAHRIRFSSGPQPLAITTLPLWTITAAPVRIGSLCDEEQDSVAQKKIFHRRTNFESKTKANCISVKTNQDHYEAGFQVCFAAASQNAGIHDSRHIDTCFGNWRLLRDFCANQWS